jgi:hypothetical protein
LLSRLSFLSRWSLPAVLVGSLVAACGADPSATVPVATPGPIVSTTVAAVGSTSAAPTSTVAAPSSLQFSADLVGGGKVDFRDYAGTTLALWFWAPT